MCDWKTGATGIVLLVASSLVCAEPYGLLNGRSANISSAVDKSIDVGVVFGKFNQLDYEHLGARFNFKVNTNAVVYGDIGHSQLESDDEVDGFTFGVGGFWQIDNVLSGADFGVHASFHRIDMDDNSSTSTFEGNSLMIESVFSTQKPIDQAGNINLYGSLGVSRTALKDAGGNSETDTELTFSGGMIFQTKRQGGEFFAGLFFLENLGFGAGYRHFLN